VSVLSSTASGRRLLIATVILLGVDVIGGLLAVASDVNTWGEAWSSRALLAAPLPMMVAQLVLAWLAARNVRPPVGLVAAALLSVACVVSVVSGFFDGGLANEALSAGLVVWQVLLLSVTAAVGLLSIARTRELLQGR
jgi:hypothetical protein